MKRVLVTVLVVLVLSASILMLFHAMRQSGYSPQPQKTLAANTGGIMKQSNQRGGNRTLQDPAAREALSHVGADAKAEEYWRKAINNPDLPAKERQDLIEDLNEEGFADPKNLSANDLPLILNRIAIIEKLDAMDDVNAAAIKEAHKDLVKMRDSIRPPAQ